jgi:hypothetical protein
MQHNDDGNVTFEAGDYVGDNATGTERFGEVIDAQGDFLTVSPDGTKNNAWVVSESMCYPG